MYVTMMFLVCIRREKRTKSFYSLYLGKKKKILAKIYTKTGRENLLYRFDFCIIKKLLVIISVFSLQKSEVD